MVIQHNLAAMNANEANRKNVSGLKKRTEKLSTGYKINRAADNAAGLSISEKMRSQINGLSQATCNSNDAVSLIQTAEGGLGETEDIAQRMRELAVQAANGTYTDDDRQQIQYEIDALKGEVTRIAESTEFNTIKLLDGSKAGRTPSCQYGARYGIVAGDDAGSLAGAILTSNIAGVNVVARPDASGRGAENAFWSDDGRTLTMNLTPGEIYPQSYIDGLIKNANRSKGASNAPAEVTLTFDPAFLRYEGDIASTGYTVPGVRATGEGSLLRLVSPNGVDGGQIDSADKIMFTANTYGKPEDIGYVHSFEIRLDVGADEEKVDVKECKGYAGAKDVTLHLATGVTYTEKDIENLLAKEGFDYTVDLSDQVDPDGDSDVHVRFLHSATTPLEERVQTYTRRKKATEAEPEEGVQYYLREPVEEVTITGITSFQAGYTYYYEDTGLKVDPGDFADPSKTYKRVAGSGYNDTPVSVGEHFDPDKEYYRDYTETRVTTPSVGNPTPRREKTSDQTPVEGKTYYEKIPGTYQREYITGFPAVTNPYWYKRPDGTYSKVMNGATFDSSLEYYTQLTPDSYVEANVSNGFEPNKEYYEYVTPQLPDYGVWIEMTGGQGVGYEQYEKGGDGLIFQIGANGVEDQKLYVTIDDMRAAALGLDDVFIDPIERALEAIGIIDKALGMVSEQRSKLGAVQNRLEHTTNSLNVSNENLSAAESQIRDTDMALEMTAYTKDNILQQASQAMLAQANQMTQGILQLLG